MAPKLLLIAALLSSASAATAADIGPKVGYSIGRQVYLANPDGTGIKQLYTGAARKSIFSVQLKPGGGEAAFEEIACCTTSSSSLLKIVRYDANGVASGTVSKSICGRVGGLAYHPTDGSLLYISSCDHLLKRLNTATMVSTTVNVPHQVLAASWLPSGTELLYASSTGKFWRVAITTPNSPTTVGDWQCLGTLDAGNSTNQALYTCPDSVMLLNLSTGQSSMLRQGEDARFSPTDSQYAYLTPRTTTGRYLLISNLDGSGTQSRIGAKDKYLSVDWRK